MAEAVLGCGTEGGSGEEKEKEEKSEEVAPNLDRFALPFVSRQ